MKPWALLNFLGFIGLTIVNSANAAPPQITSTAPTTVEVGQTYSYQVEAADPEAGALVFELQVLPNGMTISPAGLISWTPTAQGAGIQTFKVNVRDQEDLEAFQYVDLMVSDPNNTAPAINQEPLTTVTIGNTYSYDLQASDADGDTLSYRVWSWPSLAGLTISAQGVVDWTPVDRNDAGEYWVTVEADDGRLGVAKREYYLTATDPNNNAPVIAGVPVTDAIIDQPYTFDLQVTDADGDTLIYEFGTWPQNIGAQISADGVITWTPTRDNVGENWISTTVHDGHLGQAEFAYTLNVTDPNNQNPQITSTPITQATQSVTYEYIVIASDPDLDVVTLSLFDGPEGMVLDQPTNTLIWTPQQISTEGEHVKIDARDNFGGFTRQEFLIIVNDGGNTNDAPIANNQSITTVEDSALAITLTAVDPEGQPLTYSVSSQPLSGSLSGSGAELTYTPAADFYGTDSFIFTASDGVLTSAPATISIVVTSANDAPLATNLSRQVNEDTTVAVQLQGSDVDGDALTYTIASQPLNGILSGTAPDLTYTPNADFTGLDNFTYRVNDSSLSSGIATVSITVNEVNDAPVADTLALQTDEETAVVAVLAGSDADGDSLTYTIASQPTNGTLSGSAPNLTYTPNTNFSGNDSFTYQVNDGVLDSNIATVTIAVNTINDVPVAQDVTAQTNEDTTATINLVATDADQDGLTYQVVTQPQRGVLTGSGATLTYTPTPNYFGTDTFTYRANDGTADSNTATVTVTINPVNDSPIAQNITVQTAEDTAAAITLIGSDSDSAVLTYSVVTQPSNGSLSGTAPNVSYTPANNFSGSDSFTYRVNDGLINSSIATVSITVTAVNDAPVAQNITGAVNEDATVLLTLSANDSDADPLTFTVVTQPQNGTLSGTGAEQTYTPNPNYSGVDSFTYSANDGTATSNTAIATITVNPVNDAPVAENTVATIPVNQVATINLTATDIDGDILAYSLVSQPQNGTAAIQDNVVTYTPNNNYSGTDNFTFAASDGVLSANATVSITVTPAPNSPPQITSTPVLVGIESSLYEYTIEATDPDGDALSYSVIEGPSGLVVDNSTAIVSWASPVLGDHSIILEVADTHGLTDRQEFTLQIVSQQPPLTTVGRDFWAMFNTRARNEGDPQMYEALFASAAQNGQLHVEATGLGIDLTFPLVANEVLTIDLTSYLPEDVIHGLGINNYGIHVTSDVDISLHLINQANFSSDASLLIPVPALGTDYMAMSYANFHSWAEALGYGRANYIGIVATEDNTTIDIDPVSVLIETENVSDSITEPYQIILNRGESYQAIAKGGTQNLAVEVTGATISADKPVAVFSGDRAAGVQANHGDHLVEQVPPIASWSSSYLTFPLATRFGDTFRVLASENNTVVWVNDVAVALLNRGEHYETILEEPAHIVASSPILVAQFSNGAQFDSGQRASGDNRADPFMAIVPPVEQFISTYNIATPIDLYSLDFVNIIAPASAIGSIRLDGSPVDTNLFVTLPDSDFMGATISVSDGQHNLTGDEAFGVYVYGFNEFESYGYIGGMALAENTAVTSVNVSLDRSQPMAGQTVCVIAELRGADNDLVTQNQVSFTRQFSGLSQRTVRLSDVLGQARYCYEANTSGQETIVVEVQSIVESINIDWSPFVLPENRAPQFISIPVLHATPGAQYSYQFRAQDLNDDELIFSIADGPEGMTINTTTGLVEWATPVDFIEAFVSLSVSDGLFFSTQEYRLTATPGANHSPVFTTEPVTTAMTGRDYDYHFFARDEDNYPPYDSSDIFTPILSPDSRTYELVQGPVGMELVVVPSGTNHHLIWNNLAQADIGSHPVSLRVTDIRGGSTTQDFTVNVVANALPQFNSTPIVNAVTQHDYFYYFDASDENGDALQFSLESAPQGMTLVASARYLRWRPTADQIGDHTITLVADDQFGGITRQTFTLNVTENQSPIFTSAPLTNATIGRSYRYILSSTDPEGDVVTYGLVSGPAGLTVSGPDVRWNSISAAEGVYPVVVSVTDNRGGYSEQSYSINVSLNYAPEFTSTPIYGAVVGQPYFYQLTLVDQNGDDFSVRRVTPLSGSSFSNNALSWTPTNAQLGTHSLVFEANDIYGAVSQQAFNVVVIDNALTIVNAPQDTTIIENESYSFGVQAIHPTGLPISYSLPQAPAGMSIDANGVIRWVPVNAQMGAHLVEILASDGAGQEDRATFTITVSDDPNENQLPIYTGTPLTRAYVDINFQDQILATDSDGDTLTYDVIGPVGMTVSATGLLDWTPSDSDVGEHPIELRILDGTGFTRVTYNLTVEADVVPLDLDITAEPNRVNPGEDVLISLIASGGLGRYDTQLSMDGSPVVLVNNQATVTALTPGRYELSGQVMDSTTTVDALAHFTVMDPSDVTAPIVSIASPAQNTELTSPVDLIGTIQDDNLDEYIVALVERGSSAQQIIARGTSNINNAVITTIDPTVLINGQYAVVVQATDINGLQSSQTVNVVVEGDLKVGNFSFTVTDLEIPMAGIPIRVNRTYDSRRRHEDLDFGYGWSIDYQNIRVDESRTPGLGWELNEYETGPFGVLQHFCVEPIGAPVITLTLPNGDVERFETAADPWCEISPHLDVNLVFTAVEGTESTLETVGDAGGRLTSGNIADLADASAIVNPDHYRLTTRTGYIYTLSQTFGIQTITDPNGYVLTYTDNGIFHSSGKSILFNRDANGHIVSIVDPAGNTLDYRYDLTGDLREARNTLQVQQNEDGVSYDYNRSHGLLDITDPLGRSIVRNIYDEAGRLTAQEDEDGNRTEFNHDLPGRVSVVTNRLGHNTQYNYDERGNVLSQVDALGNTRLYTYDADDNQLTETNELGHRTEATYNTRHDQLTQTDALGNELTYAYNSRGQETHITDARGNEFANVYDLFGNLLSVTDPEGNSASNLLDGGLVSTTTDVLGNVTSFTYDDEGNKLTETDPLGVVTTFTYDANNNVLTETRTRTVNGTLTSETTQFVYDSRNLLTQTTDALGNVTQTEYNLAGQESARIDNLGRRTEMDYDVYGNLLETRYPDGTTETHTYDAENNKLTSSDRLGRTTSFTYDVLNRQISMAYADATSTQTEYDAAGRVIAEIDERGNRTRFEYDAANRRTATIDALGNRHTFNYDADGNLISETDANGNVTSYTYNSLDQRTQTLFANGSTSSEAFDALSRRTQMTDQAGINTAYQYDALGRLLSITDTLGQVTAYTYDEQGNKLTQTDAEGRTTTWTYDALGRVLTRTLPLGQQESFVYDANGNMTQRTDFNGAIHTYTYDINDRLIQTDFADGSQEVMTYDAVGNRLSATTTDSDGTRTWTYTYDNRNRLIQESKPDGSVLGYGYDATGNKTTLTTTRGANVRSESSTHDVLNRLAQVTDHNAQVTTYSYDAVGNRMGMTHGNGNVTLYSYDTLNRLTNLTTLDGLGATLLNYSYTLDATGRRTQIIESTGRVTDYAYDDLYRLTSETITDSANGNYSAQYSYDQVGNRVQSIIDGVTTAYTYDNNDRIAQYGGTAYSYDANGNTLTETLDGVAKTYTYNSQNELVSVEESGNTTTYQYNADGIRAAQTSTGVTTSYLVDHNRDYAQVLSEVENGTEVVNYTYGDDLISQQRGTATSFYHYDGLGSTRALTDTNGVLTDSYHYEAFGETLAQTGSTLNNYLFTGEQFDQGLNQYYLRARYYNQNNGRFTQMDTWMGRNQDPITLHKYLYANSDPANYTDPTGNFSLGQLMGAINTLSTLVNVAQGGYSLFQIATGKEELTAKDVGMAILFTGVSGKAMKMMLGAKYFNKVCGNSFEADTLVWTQRGLIKISDINIGESVLSYNESLGLYEYNNVIHLIQGEGEYQIVEIVTLDGNVSSTDNHRYFLSTNDWVEARDIQVGDEILTSSGNYSKVLDKFTIVKNLKVFNLTVDNLHNYFVGEEGILAHNVNVSCPIPAIKKGGPSGVASINKFLNKNWDKGTFGATKKSIEYHVLKHGKGLTPIQYTQRALQAFSDNNSIKNKVKDLSGKAAIKVISKYGSGLYTPKGKIIWYHPRI